MSEPHAQPTVDTEARKAALEIVSTLVHVKKLAADRLLRPTGIPDPLIRHFLKGKDATTGEALSKRQAASSIFDELAQNGQDRVVIRKLMDIAADWTAFELAQDEYKARAVVQKARQLVGTLAESEARERADREAKKAATEARQRLERETTLRKQSTLLLAQFEAHAKEENPQTRWRLRSMN